MSSPRPRPAGRLVVATATAAALLLGACGDDEPGAVGRDAVADHTTEGHGADDATTDGDLSSDGGGEVVDGVLTVELVDYAFVGVPASVPAGTRIEVVNTSSAEYHEMVVYRLPDDEERTAEEILALPEEEQGEVFGGGAPAAVLLAGPDGGEPVAAVGDGTLTEPGRYVLFCSIPTGADPEAYARAAENPEGGAPEPGADDGPPHFVHGMAADLVVE